MPCTNQAPTSWMASGHIHAPEKGQTRVSISLERVTFEAKRQTHASWPTERQPCAKTKNSGQRRLPNGVHLQISIGQLVYADSDPESESRNSQTLIGSHASGTCR